MDHLQRLSAALATALTPAQVAAVSVDRSVAILGASAGSLALLDAAGTDLEVVQAVGYPSELLAAYRRFPLTASLPIADAARTSEPILLGSRCTWAAQYPHLAAHARTEAGAWAAFPLLGQGRAIGAIGLSFAEPQEFGEDDHALLIALGQQLGQAFERARLYEAAIVENRLPDLAAPAHLSPWADPEALRALVQASPLAIITLDPRGNVQLWNPAAERLFGWREEEVVGRPYPLTPPDQVGEMLALRARLLGGEPIVAVETRRQTRHGSLIDVSISAAPLRDVAGAVVGLMAVMADISDRKRAEVGLSFLAEASQVLGASLDYETTLDSVARLAVPALADWCAVHVVEEDGSIRPIAVAHTDPAKVDLARELQIRYPVDPNAPQGVARALRTGQPEFYPEIPEELVTRTAQDAEHLEILRGLGLRAVIITPMTARGRTLGAISFISAESGHRYSQADLNLAQELARRAAVAVDNARLYRDAQTERDRLQQILDVLPEAVVLADARGRISVANAAAQSILGRPLPEANLYSYEVFGIAHLDGSPWPSVETPLARSILRGEVVHGEQMLIRDARTDRPVPVLVNTAPLRDASGAINGGIAVFQDISPIKDLERQKDEFLAAVSHDLKNPLTAIKGQAQLLLRRLARSPDPEEARLAEGLDSINQTATRATALISELLDIARLQMGQPLDLDRREIDLVALVRRVVDQRTPSDHHRIRVETDLPALPGRWDGPRLERVLGNLLVNAQKYSPDGGEIVVTVAREGGAGGEWAVLQVRDPGIGIPPGELPRIFDRFYRGSNAVGRVEGTGIGLASARQIVEQHGGTLSADSRLGAGSTFTLRLPLDPA